MPAYALFPYFSVGGLLYRVGRGAPASALDRGITPRESQLRSSAAISRAILRARSISEGFRDMAATRGCPPPPNFSASEARFFSADAAFQGLDPMEIFARTGDAVIPTE